jgi:cystathionine beta-lyase
MEESQRSAQAVAEWLQGQKRVTEVYYPGLPEHPGVEVHARQSSGPGAVLSFRLESVELTKRLLEQMKLAAFAVSLGGVESIISYPAKMSHAAMPPHERAARGVTDDLVRLSVGLEETEDLIDDLDRVINRG